MFYGPMISKSYQRALDDIGRRPMVGVIGKRFMPYSSIYRLLEKGPAELKGFHLHTNTNN